VPPAVYERGVNRRPTLVQNVETLAHIALIARYGADWFRTAGTSQDPGTMLFTVSGAVRHPGVIEAPVGVTARQLLAQAGWTAPLQALLVGGYHGSWLGVPAGLDLPLSAGALKPLGLSPGAGVVVAFPADSCGLVETSRVANYMADVSAGQCGPCLNGLPALAETFAALAALQRSPRLTTRIEELCGLVQGRGACHHPDGTTRFVRSALVVFEAEVRAHLAGRCTATSRQPVLPTPYERS
jgi:NADH:ubiquinone oxidoreductase subunit F (NADH-binding)